MIRTHVMWLLALGLAVSACSRKEQAPAPAAKATAQRQAGQAPAEPVDSPAPAPARTGKRGLEAVDNDPGVLAEINKVLKCEWRPQGFAPTCAALKALRKGAALKRGRDDATLVNLLEDDDPKVRWLAALMLNLNGKAYQGDAALARRVLAAAEQEKVEAVAVLTMDVVAKLELKGTKLLDRVTRMGREHPLAAARVRLVRGVQPRMWHKNLESEQLFFLVLDCAREDSSEQARRAGLQALGAGTSKERVEEVCRIWREAAQNERVPALAALAMGLAIRSPDARCLPEFDGLIDVALYRARHGRVQDTEMVTALKDMHDQKKGIEAHRQRSLEVLRITLEEIANKDTARAAALRFLGQHDPRAKQIAARYLKDGSALVKKEARRITRGK